MSGQAQVEATHAHFASQTVAAVAKELGTSSTKVLLRSTRSLSVVADALVRSNCSRTTRSRNCRFV